MYKFRIEWLGIGGNAIELGPGHNPIPPAVSHSNAAWCRGAELRTLGNTPSLHAGSHIPRRTPERSPGHTELRADVQTSLCEWDGDCRSTATLIPRAPRTHNRALVT